MSRSCPSRSFSHELHFPDRHLCVALVPGPRSWSRLKRSRPEVVRFFRVRCVVIKGSLFLLPHEKADVLFSPLCNAFQCFYTRHIKHTGSGAFMPVLSCTTYTSILHIRMSIMCSNDLLDYYKHPLLLYMMTKFVRLTSSYTVCQFEPSWSCSYTHTGWTIAHVLFRFRSYTA